MAPDSGLQRNGEATKNPETETDKGNKAAREKGKSNVQWFAPCKRSDKVTEMVKNKIKALEEYFKIEEKVGEGSFSSVFKATLRKDPTQQFAVKQLIPTCHPTRIIRELQCLQTIGGQENVIGVNVCLRNEEHIAFVMPYLPHQKFSSYVLKMDVAETQLYMKNLLIALQRVHSFGIIHRDVKPSNFLYDREQKKFLLIDFGLAQPQDDVLKEASKNEKKRKRTSVNENVENTQKSKDGCDEQYTQKRFVLQPLINNASLRRPAVKRKLKQDSGNSSAANATESESANERVSGKPISFSSKFADALKSSARRGTETNSHLPKTSISSDPQPQDRLNRSEPSCSSYKFQRLTPNPKNSCNKVSNFLVQGSQVKEKIDGKSTRTHPAGPEVFPQPTRRAPSSKNVRPCTCSNKGQICNGCMTRKAPNAARAGTPGFRPPEVLLRYPNQTTAVDIWSAGVIFISILSGCSPFFRSSDDVTALAEIMTLFGTTNIKNLAAKLGINVLCNEERIPYNLKLLCEKLRRRKFQKKSREDETWKNYPFCAVCYSRKHPTKGCVCDNPDENPSIRFPLEAYDLLEKLLNIDPTERITATEALEHPFLTMNL